MSSCPLVSPSTRLVARDANATQRPSALKAGLKLPAFPWLASGPTLTRLVCPVLRS